MKLMIKRLFCRHDYQWCRKIQSFSGLNGERVYLVCQKCGKVRDTMFLEVTEICTERNTEKSR